MPALVASRCDPHAKVFFESLLGSKQSPSTGAHCCCEEVAARHIWNISERPEVRGSKAVSKDHFVLTESP